MKRAALLAGAALVGLLIGPAPAASQSDPYAIDVILNQTGANAYSGANYAAALRAFEAYANAHGGIAGRPLRFVYHDDQTNPATAVQIAADILQKHPAVVIGSTQVAECAAIAPLMANGPVDYCISPGYNPASHSYVFAASARAENLSTGALRFLRLKGFRRLAIVSATDATGEGIDAALRYVLTLPENRGLHVVAWEHFNDKDLSVAAQAERVKAADPDAVISYAAGTAFGTVLRNLSDAGVHVPLLTSPANVDPAFLDQYAAVLPADLYFTSSLYYGRNRLPAGELRSTIDDFFNALRAANVTLAPSSGFAWDAAWVIVSALRKLGPDATATQLREYLLNLHDFAGVDGIYDFRSGDQHGLDARASLLVRWNPSTKTFSDVSTGGGYPV